MNNRSSSLQNIVDEIEEAFISLPDRRTATVRALSKSYARKLKSESGSTILELATLLVERAVEQNDFLLRLIGYEMIRFHSDAVPALNSKWVERLGDGMNDWKDVDTFCTLVAGQAWRRGDIDDKQIRKWAASSDRWWRRSALVATVPLNNKTQGGEGDPERTLMICKLLVDDRDDMVVKAMSWALRELAKRDPEPVELFMDEMGERAAPRVQREVTNKLTTGLKNPK